MTLATIPAQVEYLANEIKSLQEKFSDVGYDVKNFVQSEIKSKWRVPHQALTMYGMHTAYVIETIDPWKQNQVRFFSPSLHDPNTRVSQLPFAHAISPQGGFDDCGCTWVPPAGSKVCLIFEKGNRQRPFYLGTTWDRDRGSDGEHTWNYPMPEYEKYHEGKRTDYMVGDKTGAQVFPAWNTEQYNGPDIDHIQDFYDDLEQQKKITIPHIYGWKTPQGHMAKWDDGDYKCNHRWARMEFKSAGGGFLIFKDDHLHPAGQWVHPDCGCGGGDVSECDEDATECANGDQSTCANIFHKHKGECRPYSGPGTPQNNKCDNKTLPQSGFQILSPSGHTLWADDSVEEPEGIPDRQRGIKPFDFGCTDKFTGKFAIVSATGHSLELSDVESSSKLRGEDNYIRLLSAAGNKIELNDQSLGCGCAGGADLAGPSRGITLETTSQNSIVMSDHLNEQCSPCRKGGGSPTNKATAAFIRIRTGYGLEMHFGDDDHQTKTRRQYIQIFCPQKENEKRGPHIQRFQERKEGPGQIFLRAGGDYITSTYDNHYAIVGDKEENPANKIRVVSKHTLNKTENFYFNTAETHAFMADKVIMLMAGSDCEGATGDECSPCLWPVLCLRGRQVVASDRLFASASGEAPCISIMQCMPFTAPCSNEPPCS